MGSVDKSERPMKLYDIYDEAEFLEELKKSWSEEDIDLIEGHFSKAIDRKKSFITRVKEFIKGETKLGRIVGILLDFGLVLLPYGKQLSSGREALKIIINKDKKLTKVNTNNNKKRITMKWIITRLKEPSTWQGIITFIVGIGVYISPELQDALIYFGVALFSLISIIKKERSNEDTE